MLCQDCPDHKTCTELCERAEKYVNKGYRSQFELTVGGEAKYDNSSIWPDDPDGVKDPDVLTRQVRQSEGSYVQGRASTVVPYSEAASYWKSESVNFECLTPLQNKCIHLFHFEGLTLAEIAQRVRKRKTAVKGQLQRARAKLRSVYSKDRGEPLNILDKEKARKEFHRNENGTNST